jgi:arginyl-tRNA--protein-N-Asp/Glu arginylyltransferase
MRKLHSKMPLENEVALAENPFEPYLMDALWARGWRHFGPMLFRYSETDLGSAVGRIIPLRIDLEKFRLSESQRRTLRRNVDLCVSFGAPVIRVPERTLFHAHASRFRENIPSAPETFLGTDPASGIPCEIRQLSVTGDGGCLLAASYVAVGSEAWSSIYAMFDPAESRRRLGIATLLWEIEAAREAGCRWLYHGYAFREPSHYDYKKGFSGLEWYDWERWNDTPPPGVAVD